MKVACQYAIVRFLPFVETEEFANVGIVLFCPDRRFFGFQLEHRYGRLTQFFDGLDGLVYRRARSAMCEQLEHERKTLEQLIHQGTEGAVAHFNEIIRPRESILRFSKARVALTEHPQQLAQELFDFYVHRNFVTREYIETQLEVDIRKLLKDNHLASHYHEKQVGDEALHVKFPFVHESNGRAVKIIKPFALSQEDPNKIYAHGGPWIDKIRRLRKHNLLHADTLFAVQGPEDAATSRRHRAYAEICDELEQQGVLVVPWEQQQGIVDFAHVPSLLN